MPFLTPISLHPGPGSGFQPHECAHAMSLLLLRVVEVLPSELAERMELQAAGLEAGKATCVWAAHSQRCLINVQLMDVLDLQLSL